MTSVVEVMVDVGILGLAVGMLLALYQMVKGPHLADRAIAGDILSLFVVGLVVLLAVDQRRAVSLDAALLVAIVGFAVTVETPPHAQCGKLIHRLHRVHASLPPRRGRVW